MISPAIGSHRLVGSGRSVALVTQDGEIDWWCAPDLDDLPVLWSLLDPEGARARWRGARPVAVVGRPAGPEVEAVVAVEGRRVRCRDGLVDVDGASHLVRLVRSEGGPVQLRHELSLGGFDSQWTTPVGSTLTGGDLTASVLTDGVSVPSGRDLLTDVIATADRWTGLAVTVGSPAASLVDVVAALDEAKERADELLRRARLPRHHRERAADALAVLAACTYEPTGAVIAAATTSLPEAPGADRQFDYRYCWLRDAALATSVASLLGRPDVAQRYLHFLHGVVLPDLDLHSPVVDVRGGDVPAEREVQGVRGWGDSRPVRLGNGARGQLQYDAWGLVLEAVSVHLQTGGARTAEARSLVRSVADRLASEPGGSSHGIWEHRDEKPYLSGDIGRWLALDRAMWIARGWYPFTPRRHWKRARDEARRRVLDALDDDGRLPQVHGADRADASALMAPLFGLLSRRDRRARELIDVTLRDLGVGPYVYRYEPDGTDGFAGREGAFLPASWWAVAALAVTGRLREARARADDLCARLPGLLSEEVDPVSGQLLGNVPLVWSHMELARVLYVLDAAAVRHRFGTIGLWAWRLARYARLRWGRASRRSR